MCPQGLEYCSWRGPLCEVASHMRTTHKLEALQDVGVSVEIYSFRKKAEAVDGRQYTVNFINFQNIIIFMVTNKILNANRLKFYIFSYN